MVTINGNNINNYGVLLEDGNYPQLMQHPKRKEGYTHNWADQSGEDYDNQAPIVYETVVYNLSFLIVASTSAQLLDRYESFLTALTVPAGTTWQFTELNKTMKLHYVAATDFTDINFYGGSARFVIQFKNRHEI